MSPVGATQGKQVSGRQIVSLTTPDSEAKLCTTAKRSTRGTTHTKHVQPQRQFIAHAQTITTGIVGKRDVGPTAQTRATNYSIRPMSEMC